MDNEPLYQYIYGCDCTETESELKGKAKTTCSTGRNLHFANENADDAYDETRRMIDRQAGWWRHALNPQLISHTRIRGFNCR